MYVYIYIYIYVYIHPYQYVGQEQGVHAAAHALLPGADELLVQRLVGFPLRLIIVELISNSYNY